MRACLELDLTEAFPQHLFSEMLLILSEMETRRQSAYQPSILHREGEVITPTLQTGLVGILVDAISEGGCSVSLLAHILTALSDPSRYIDRPQSKRVYTGISKPRYRRRQL